MKRVLIGLLIFLAVWIFWSYLSTCGRWSVFGGGRQTPTCNCLGKIIETGGPTGPADDSGGYFNCVGFKIP